MTEEYFDIYDEQMNPIGTATRSETHAKGYWHRSFHCWLTRKEEDRRYVRFQLRQSSKDTCPDCYDITVAGHLSAGETMRDAARELQEEIGVTASFGDLIPLGQLREDTVGTAGGTSFIDREVSDVFGFVCSLPLMELQLQVEEVAGVYEADLEELLQLFEHERTELMVSGVAVSPDGGQTPSVKSVRVEQFVPRKAEYYASVMRALRDCT